MDLACGKIVILILCIVSNNLMDFGEIITSKPKNHKEKYFDTILSRFCVLYPHPLSLNLESISQVSISYKIHQVMAL